MTELQLGDAERGYVYAIGRRFVHDTDAADEVAQDAMLLAHRHRASFRGDAHPRTWLYRIAATTAFHYLRRTRRRLAQDAISAELSALQRGDEPAADDAIAARQEVARITRELARLDDKYAAVLRLRIAELGDHEIADRLGITLGTVKVRAHRARTMIRAALADAA